jgi:hypothetical protein
MVPITLTLLNRDGVNKEKSPATLLKSSRAFLALAFRQIRMLASPDWIKATIQYVQIIRRFE